MTKKVWAWFIKYLFLGVLWLQALYALVPVGPVTAATQVRTVPQTPGQLEEQIWLEGCMAVAFPLGLHPNPHTGLGLGCLAGRESQDPGQGEPVCVPPSGEWSSTCTCVTLGHLPHTGDSSVPSLTPCDVRVPLASARGRQISCPGCPAPEPPLTDGSVGQQCPAHTEAGPSWQQPLCNSRALALL